MQSLCQALEITLIQESLVDSPGYNALEIFSKLDKRGQ
jgi:hypothetical protein